MSNAAPATSTEIHDAAPPRPSRSVIVGVRLLPDELRALESARRGDANGRVMSRAAWLRARLLAALDGGR